MEFHFEFDPSQLLKAYQKGTEDAFIMMADFNDMDETLNCIGIVTNDDCEEA